MHHAPLTIVVDTDSIQVLGAGVLGRRIAAVWASGGHHVNIRDLSDDALKSAQDYVDSSIDFYCKSTGIKPGQISLHTDLAAAVKSSWLVVECVPEKLELKQSTFTDLEKLAPQDAILATNSSSYKSSEMVGHLSEQATARTLNMHYMMPPNQRVVELMTCGNTDPSIFPFLVDELKK